MKIKNPLPLNSQDKIEQGVIRTEDNVYVNIGLFDIKIEGVWTRFDNANAQDKLRQGLVKLKGYEAYLPIASLRTEEFRITPPAPLPDTSNAGDECFVATAVYGNPNAPEVETLRQIRDNVLRKNQFGEAFVQFYYSGAGEKTANFVRQHLPSTIPVIRKGLDFIVSNYNANKK